MHLLGECLEIGCLRARHRLVARHPVVRVLACVVCGVSFRIVAYAVLARGKRPKFAKRSAGAWRRTKRNRRAVSPAMVRVLINYPKSSAASLTYSDASACAAPS